MSNHWRQIFRLAWEQFRMALRAELCRIRGGHEWNEDIKVPVSDGRTLVLISCKKGCPERRSQRRAS